MVKKALMLLGVLAIVGVAGLSLLLPDAVSASGHSATRSFANNSVITGAEVEIEISVSGLGGFGQVRETLPEGFSFAGSDESAVVDGQNVSFTILASEATISYTVTASSTAGTYDFSGTVADSDKESVNTGGDSSIEVTDPPLGAERSISRSSVSTGEQITVSIAASGFDTAASVVENVPAGLTYTSSSLSSAAVNVAEDSVSFTLLDEDSFSYTLTAGDPGEYAISGTITDLDRVSLDITGDDSVTVAAAVPAMASRSFGVAFAESEGEIAVTIAAAGYGPAAQIVETLPEGFSYVGTDLAGGAADTSGQTVTFVILGEDSFSYTVSAPAELGAYTFAGALEDINKASVDIAGDTVLYVGNPGIEVTDSGVREINENTPTGVRIGDPVAASSAVSALTFEITSAAADTFDIEPENGQLRTKGDLDYETRASYSLQVTITDEYGESESLVITIRVLDRDEYVPPTATPVPTATATAVPPTATATAVPPTATSVPPTAAPEPTVAPEPTAVPEPEDEGGFPVWAIIVIVLAVVAGVAIIGFVVYRRREG